jgi:hypothetical protein
LQPRLLPLDKEVAMELDLLLFLKQEKEEKPNKAVEFMCLL